MRKVKNILSQLAGLQECYALNVHAQSASQFECNVFFLKLNKGRVTYERKELEAVNLKAKLVFVNIFGGQCLIRPKQSANQKLEALVPGIDIADFCIDENQEQFALVRRAVVDNIVNTYNLNQSIVCAMQILPRKEHLSGFSVEKAVWGTYELVGESLVPSNEEGCWTNEDGDSFEHIEIPAVASARWFLETNQLPFDINAKEGDKSLLAYKAFNLGWKAAVLVLFIGLSLNYYLFDKYAGQADRASTQIQQNENWVRELKQLQTAYNARKEFVESKGLNSRTINAFLVDQVCEPVPKGIQLTQVLTRPYTNKNGRLSFQEDGMQIVGHSFQTNALSIYIAALKEIPWATKVDLISVKKDPSKDFAVFRIKIQRAGDER